MRFLMKTLLACPAPRLIHAFPAKPSLDNHNSSEADTDAVKRDAREFGRPCLAGWNWKCTRQRSRRDDLAGCEWRIDLIACENIDEMTQCRHRSTQHIRSATVIDDRAVALQIDFEGRKRSAPIFGVRCDRMTRPD